MDPRVDKDRMHIQGRGSVSNLRLVAIPRLAAGGRWRVEAMRALSEPCLLWFTKGQGRITLNGATRGYTAHNAIFIPPGKMHGYEAGANVFGTAVFFGRDCDVTLPKDILHLRVRDVYAQQELNVILDSILREMDSDNAAFDRATRHYLGLLGVWLERQARKSQIEAPKPDAARRLVARYTDLMERDFRSGAGVSYFAHVLGVTPTHLTRCCQQTCGRPASQLLQDRRIFEARKLLAETVLPVHQIGQMLGFRSAAYFTRAFQHQTGSSPTRFRRTP